MYTHSLSATFLRNQIIGALSSATDAEAQKAANGVTQDFVFNYSTLRQLTIATIDLINNSTSQPDRTTSIKELISRFSDLPQVSSQESQSSSTSIVVLTGSTGALGSHILASLLLEPQVTKVYTLNRGKDIQARQKLSFSQKGLPEGLLVNPKLTQLTADLSHPTLGLDEETFEKVGVTKHVSLSALNLYHAGNRLNHLQLILFTMLGEWISTFRLPHSIPISQKRISSSTLSRNSPNKFCSYTAPLSLSRMAGTPLRVRFLNVQ